MCVCVDLLVLMPYLGKFYCPYRLPFSAGRSRMIKADEKPVRHRANGGGR